MELKKNLELVLKDEVVRRGFWSLWSSIQSLFLPYKLDHKFKGFALCKEEKNFILHSEIRLLQNWIIQIPLSFRVVRIMKHYKMTDKTITLKWKISNKYILYYVWEEQISSTKYYTLHEMHFWHSIIEP